MSDFDDEYERDYVQEMKDETPEQDEPPEGYYDRDDDQVDEQPSTPAVSVAPEHFKGCHPEHEHHDETPEGHQPQETEPRWHCGTPTPHGCDCLDCVNDPYIGPAATYHCPTCGRWWAYMTGLNITTITFPGTKADAAGGEDA